MRSALVRFAQPEPALASVLLGAMRRLDAVLAHLPAGDDPAVPPLLDVAALLDELGDTLAAWADCGIADPPTDAVAATAAAVTRRMDELGVPVEDELSGRPRRGRAART